MVNCNNCKSISITEEQQIYNKISHKCLKHKTKLFHRNNILKIEHNFIYPCKKCNGKDFEKR